MCSHSNSEDEGIWDEDTVASVGKEVMYQTMSLEVITELLFSCKNAGAPHDDSPRHSTMCFLLLTGTFSEKIHQFDNWIVACERDQYPTYIGIS